MSQTNLERIPAELRSLPRWICWRMEERPDANGEMQPTKVPYRADGRGKAKTADGRGKVGSARTTWGTFSDAVAASKRLGFDGIGFVFSDDDDLMGIDLDHCRDPRTGAIAPAAQELVDAFDTYTEVSTSGSGVHLILRGHFEPGTGNRKPLDGLNVEMYTRGRYFCMTGNVVDR